MSDHRTNDFDEWSFNKLNELEERTKKLESLHNEKNSPETFIALSKGIALGTSDLMGELAILKMKLENNDIEISNIKKKYEEIQEKNKRNKNRLNKLIDKVNEL